MYRTLGAMSEPRLLRVEDFGQNVVFFRRYGPQLYTEDKLIFMEYTLFPRCKGFYRRPTKQGRIRENPM